MKLLNRPIFQSNHRANDSGLDSATNKQELERALLRLIAVPMFAMLTAIGAQIAVPTPPFGIPVTLQTLMVLLAAMTLGPRLGFASMALYLVMGIIGFGVFAQGQAGWIVVIGQTGGYLFGFLVCQPVAHALIRKRDGSVRGWLSLFLAGIAVHMVIFTFGVSWLWWIHLIDNQSPALSFADALYYGFVVFIPGMILKSGIAAGIAAWTLPSVARRMW
jgi:biotin transport system substrate-specific component